jgi:hypothetical protein
MPMQKSKPAENPDAYVEALIGWRRVCVEQLRAAVRAAAKLEEVIKWGHIVYFSNGPVLLIRAEEQRVLFGFWRGKRLREVEERLKASGKYEMATLVLSEGVSISAATARKLVKQAVALNKSVGDPTQDAKPRKPKKLAQQSSAQRKRANAQSSA